MKQKGLMAAVVLLCLLLTGCSTTSTCTPVTVGSGIYEGCLPVAQQDFQTLHKKGIRAVLSLETLYYHTAPERELAQRNGIKFYNAPICPSVVPPTERQVKRALLILNDPTLRPIFVHCLVGDDRTTFLIGLYRMYYQHWTPQAAWDEMLRNGFHARWWLYGLETYFWHHTQTPAWAK